MLLHNYTCILFLIVLILPQLFFHKYFSRKHKQESLRARNNLANLEQNADSDNQENDVSDTSSATDEDEAEIWKVCTIFYLYQ
jgi:hypothetical protein